VIELHDVSVSHGALRALTSVSVSLEAGTVTAVAGRNGSGKSTLLSVIAGTQAHSGSVTRPGGARTAFVVQRSAVPRSLPLSVRDVVAMGRWGHGGGWRPLSRADRAVVADSLRSVGMDALQHRSFHALSGGQRQRALVAQGLAQHADILLLDEPAVGLDDESRLLIARAIDLEARRGAIVVHATHDDDVIRSAGRVIRLEAGEIAP
jgi:zinc/manganese transport system ATP-binding protein